MTDFSTQREFYEHDSTCTRTNLSETNEKGFRTCYDCAGIFKEDGKTGIAVTSSLLDEARDDGVV